MNSILGLIKPWALLILLTGLFPNWAFSQTLCKQVFSQSLSQEERDAIKAYTGGNYQLINKYLAGSQSQKAIDEIVKYFPGQKTKIRPKDIEKDIAELKAALLKLPPFEGLSSRARWVSDVEVGPSIYDKILSHYPVGKTVTEKVFSSASLWPEGAGDARTLEGLVLLKMEGKSGRLIQNFSHEAHEREVLFLPGTSFRVESARGRWIKPEFRLEEQAAFYTKRGLKVPPEEYLLQSFKEKLEGQEPGSFELLSSKQSDI